MLQQEQPHRQQSKIDQIFDLIPQNVIAEFTSRQSHYQKLEEEKADRAQLAGSLQEAMVNSFSTLRSIPDGRLLDPAVTKAITESAKLIAAKVSPGSPFGAIMREANSTLRATVNEFWDGLEDGQRAMVDTLISQLLPTDARLIDPQFRMIELVAEAKVLNPNEKPRAQDIIAKFKADPYFR